MLHELRIERNGRMWNKERAVAAENVLNAKSSNVTPISSHFVTFCCIAMEPIVVRCCSQTSKIRRNKQKKNKKKDKIHEKATSFCILFHPMIFFLILLFSEFQFRRITLQRQFCQIAKLQNKQWYGFRPVIVYLTECFRCVQHVTHIAN